VAIPKFNELFNGVLQSLSDGQEWRARDFYDHVIDGLGLSVEERSETLGRGGNRALRRAYFACEYLFQAGAISRPRRGYLQITDLGRQFLTEHPDGITVAFLRTTDGFKDWTRRTNERAITKQGLSDVASATELIESDITPEEQIDLGVSQLRANVATELLDRVRTESPRFLEEVVLKVLHAMGYGEGEDDLEHLGGTGDEGVDGVINQDKLGLDQIYVQAKRYKEDSSIGRPDIQAFVGAISGKGATRGVFITTSRFTPDAHEFATRLSQPRIILVDGNQLADLMLEHEIGVAVDKVYKVYKIDENLFEV
jgi:restriction system protein